MKFVYDMGTLMPSDPEAAAFMANAEDGTVLEFKSSRRTPKQNNALHAFLTDLAASLNSAGMYLNVFPWKEGAEVEWTMEDTKERLWKPLQKALVRDDKGNPIESTRNLERKHIDQIYQPLAKKIASMGVQVPPMGRDE